AFPKARVMRVIVDTNILLSALINPHGLPAQLIDAWRGARFQLVTSQDQLLELGEVARRPALRKYIVPAHVGRFINDLRELAEVIVRLPHVDRSRDPADNFLLAMAQASNAEYLVSGDKRDVLALKSHGSTHIVTTRRMLSILDL
ncbi:MAG TPA: putative toxin-antitoxin system toxin component, PIN family, partial [Candidatus Paceibacterota bacterium]|nr:putative toxin-antitoxin system toxin component, PIN family [Candidatus Paceibacterota bacterium]